MLDSEQSNADEGKDFRIVEAGIKAGEGLGEIVIEANMLPEGSDDKSVVLQILPQMAQLIRQNLQLPIKNQYLLM